MPWGAAALAAGGSLLGGIISSGAASDAASQQVEAANRAADLQRQQFQTTQSNLLPFLQSGTTANQVLSSDFLGVGGPGGTFNPNAPLYQSPLNKAGAPPSYNMPQFVYQHSPGYNAALQGSTEALQNAGATTTGGLSGNVLRALSGTGSQMANQDYQQNYQNFVADYQSGFNAGTNNYWNTVKQLGTDQSNIFNWLSQLSGSGQNAAVQTGGFGANAANNIGNAFIGAGNARAAGTVGSANALVGGINGAATGGTNLLNNYALLAALQQQGGGGGGYGYGPGDYGGG